MATAPPTECATQIGETAGAVWTILAENGPLSTAQLIKKVGQPRDTVMQALGWLAREGKLRIAGEGRNRRISVRQD
jgi:hypothetical protein